MDINKVREEVEGIPRDTNAESRRNRYNAALITTLLDIAESLRVLAEESRAAMRGEILNVHGTVEEIEREGESFTEGDVVYVEGVDGPGEIVGFRDTEGETFAIVRYPDGEIGDVGITVPLSALHRLTGDEGDEPDPLGGVSIGEEVDPLATYSGVDAVDHGVAPEDVVDDIDADFDGDSHTAAESALDVLKANEAARKGAKKGKKK